MQNESSIACPSCGHMISGKFCTACGEKRVSAHDFSLKHFAEETVEGITHFDNKFFKSVKTLFTRPGSLSTFFEAGKRVHYMKPVQLFVICNLLFFFLVGSANVFSISLRSYLIYNNYFFFNTKEAFEKKFGTSVNLDAATAIFNEKMATQSKSFIILFIPFVAVLCALLFIKKRKFFTQHLVFATHFFCFLLLFFTLFHLLFELPNKYLFHFSVGQFDNFATNMNMLALVVYFTFAARRYYQTSWFISILSSLAVGFWFIILLQSYRLFLFYKILPSLY